MANEKGRFLAANVHLHYGERFLIKLSARNKDRGNDLQIGLATTPCHSGQAAWSVSLPAARQIRAALDRAILQMEKDST
jgi:hypothetical protein